tara:strand:- start:1249 stop:1623 length:375 start_codon:yes stop_codon:yes gene_type:complete
MNEPTGTTIAEKSVSKKQQRFFGMVRAAQKGEMENPSPEIAKVAATVSKSDVKKMASTKHKGLPEIKKMNESVAFKKVIDVVRGKKTERKPQKAMDAGARAKRLLQRREYKAKISPFVPKELED